jgi:phytoene dehydrogenase-like protein
VSSDFDFVVAGSGPNGLVAACTLAEAGARVLVLEANATHPGGAVWSEEATEPGFVHDVGAAFFTFGKISPAFRHFDLTQHGVVWRHADFESAHPAPDGTVACISRDQTLNARTFGSLRDGEVWSALCRRHAQLEPRWIDALMQPLPATGPALRLLPFELPRMARILMSSGRALARRWFESEAARRVLPGLALHVDAGPDDRFGAGIGYMLGVVAATQGFAVPEGGARRVTEALIAILDSHGGGLQLGSRVERVVVDGKRAVAVRLGNGDEIAVRRGVLADTSAPSLFLDLVEQRHLPGRVVRAMREFKQGWGTFKVDWALDGPVPWTLEAVRRTAVVHAGDSLDDLSRFTEQVRAGELPDNPYLVVGQQSIADPTRAPEGCHTLWAYSRVPAKLARGWDEQRERFTDRIEERIERMAPGFRQLVRARRSVTPLQLQRTNANLVGGDLGGGSNAWNRQLFFRPVFPYFRYSTPVRGLFLCSSYAHPGAGVHGMCGYNAARIALAREG